MEPGATSVAHSVQERTFTMYHEHPSESTRWVEMLLAFVALRVGVDPVLVVAVLIMTMPSMLSLR